MLYEKFTQKKCTSQIFCAVMEDADRWRWLVRWSVLMAGGDMMGGDAGSLLVASIPSNKEKCVKSVASFSKITQICATGILINCRISKVYFTFNIQLPA